jgi:hypothetical protein
MREEWYNIKRGNFYFGKSGNFYFGLTCDCPDFQPKKLDS